MKRETLGAFLVLLLLAAGALGANPFAGQTVAPMDLLLGWSGWSTISMEKTVVNWSPHDIIDSVLPFWLAMKRELRSGHLPLWYSSSAGGTPLNYDLFNPLFWLFAAVKDHALAYYLVGLAKLVIAGCGTLLFLGMFVGWLPSLWGGIVFMLCGFNAAWFFWDHVSTAMWIPWLHWAVVSYLRTEDRKWLPVLSVASLLMIAGGFFSVAAFGFYSVALVVLLWSAGDLYYQMRQRSSSAAASLAKFLRQTLLPLSAIGIAFVMAGGALLPFAVEMSGVNLSMRTGGQTKFDGLADLALFFRLERPLDMEVTAYVGIPVLLFALTAILWSARATFVRTRRIVFIYGTLTAVATAIAFGLLPAGMIQTIPIFNSHPWGRLIVISHLGLAILSAFGLHFMFGPYVQRAGASATVGKFVSRGAALLLLMALLAFQFQAQKKYSMPITQLCLRHCSIR